VNRSRIDNRSPLSCRALAVYPRLERIPDVVKKLQQEVEGRDI